MTRDDIEYLAESRGQIAVLVNWNGDLRWILVDLQQSTVEYLAGCANTSRWEEWTSGNMAAFDASGQPLVEHDEVTYDWTKTPQPIEFRRMAWHVCTVAGMGRLSVHSKHGTRDLAELAAKRLSAKHYSTRVRWLPVGSRGCEVTDRE